MKKFFLKLWKSIFKSKPSPAPIPAPEVKTPQVETKPVEVPPPTKLNAVADFMFVDSSHHHAFFDPKKYKAPFLSNKCTQGTTFIDKTHATRKRLCAENDIKYSGYHFYECRRDPIDQARFYVETHGQFTSPPCIDFETSETIGQDETALFLHKEDLYACLVRIESLTGFTPWIYVNYSAAKRLKFDQKFARFPVWFARYNTTLGPIPAPWSDDRVAAWQFTDKGNFPGFDGGNDVNEYYGTNNFLNL